MSLCHPSWGVEVSIEVGTCATLHDQAMFHGLLLQSLFLFLGSKPCDRRISTFICSATNSWQLSTTVFGSMISFNFFSGIFSIIKLTASFPFFNAMGGASLTGNLCEARSISSIRLANTVCCLVRSSAHTASTALRKFMLSPFSPYLIILHSKSALASLNSSFYFLIHRIEFIFHLFLVIHGEYL